MKIRILGVLAVTSTMTLACTTTEIETTTAEPGRSEPTSPAASPTPRDSWRSKLALSKTRTGANAAAIAALSGKPGGHATPFLRSGAGPAGACGLATGDPTCDTCLDTSCCAENQACVSNADCSALLACGDACRDDACISACMTAHPTGATLLGTLSTCVEGSCGAACGGPSSPSTPSACGFGSGDPTCDACLDTSCCGDANACLGDADCIALLECAEPCRDNACVSACEAAHPSGTAKITALSTCAGTACGAACGGPPSGPGGPGGPAPAPGSCGLTSGEATCDTCLDTSCCAQTTTCIGDADCVAVIRCYDACSDSACAAACDAAHPGGSAHLTGVFTCAQASCTAACGL
jgi:hypothetical protein